MQRIQPGTTTLVDIGSYKLEVTIHGPPRRAHNPVVIIIPGISGSVKEWAAVTRSLAESISVVNYERAGFGQSDPAPEGDARTATELATELHNLLRAAKIAPPYIVLCHSYGAIIAREFVELRNLAQFKGFVFVEADTAETTMSASNQVAQALQKVTDTLQLCYTECHQLKNAEWEALQKVRAEHGHQKATDREISQYLTSIKALASKEDGNRGEFEWGGVPLVVLQADSALDLQKIYDEGVRLGNGTSNDGAEIQNLISQANTNEEAIQKKLLKLSTRSSFRYIAGAGNRIHLAAPEAVVDAVIWVLQQYRC